MAQPSKSDIYVNRPLTNISIAFIQKSEDFIADKVFPNIPVKKDSGTYYRYKKGSWYRSQMQRRAPGTESAGSGWEIDSTPKYNCEEFGLHKDITDKDRNNQDEPIDLDRDASLFLTQQFLLKRDLSFVDTYMKPGVWDTDFTPSTLWDASGSDPIKDIRTRKRVVKNKTGYMPNTLVVSGDVHDILSEHPLVIDRIKYTQRGQVTKELLASLFEVEKYLVAEAVYNTAKEGKADDIKAITSKCGLLCYANPNPSIMQPSAGYIFSSTGPLGASKQGHRIFQFRMEHLKSDRVEIEANWDMNKVAGELGMFLNGVIS